MAKIGCIFVESFVNPPSRWRQSGWRRDEWCHNEWCHDSGHFPLAPACHATCQLHDLVMWSAKIGELDFTRKHDTCFYEWNGTFRTFGQIWVWVSVSKMESNSEVFSLNFWWGDLKIFDPRRFPMGTKSMGGGELAKKKSDWSQNFPPNVKLGLFLLF